MAGDVNAIFTILSDEAPGAASLLSMARLVEAGLPLAALDRMVRAIAPNDASFVASIVPKATLSRRRAAAAGTLSAEESNKVARLAKVWAMAMRVWNDEADARTFLSRPHPMLEGRSPRDLAVASDPGADAVMNIIGRGAYGGGV
jgi:putative toxin-antitoxin system antitoxin component (TIGR02293 family)